MNAATTPYILYGAYASFYSAKTRSYLRKKGIDFIERLPSHPRFRDYVRPVAESKRIPILETPDGTVIQDTTEIFNHLEARFPSPPAFPPGPRQKLAAYLLDLFFSQDTRLAWHYRWNFPRENQPFISMDFGRSFRPQGSDEELIHYGGIIARQMDGHRARFGITPEMYPALEHAYFDLLAALEAQFTHHPYLFGGMPSIADYALMGPLFAHLGRDPYPRMLMQARAPRVFRWTEHMNTPEIRSPEFAETPAEYLPDDAVSEPVQGLLRQYSIDATPAYRASAQRFAEWVEQNKSLPDGAPISETEDQPSLGMITIPFRGHEWTCSSQIHSLWVLQRMQDWFRGLSADEQKFCFAFATENGLSDLVTLRLPRRLARVHNRLALGERG